MEEAGPADGPVILLIHGTAGWSGFWRNISGHLAARGWRVIAVDLPPFGYSEHDPQARYDRTAQATRLAEVIGHLSTRPVVVIGHSFGSGAAVELALRDPWMISRLVLVDAALGHARPGGRRRGADRRAPGQIRWIAQPLISATLTNPLRRASCHARCWRAQRGRRRLDRDTCGIRPAAARHTTRLCRLAAGAIRDQRCVAEPAKREFAADRNARPPDLGRGRHGDADRAGRGAGG